MRDWLYPYYCGAGWRARNRYREASNRWRQRVFRRPRLITAVFVLIIATIPVVVKDAIWAWMLGLFGGCLLGAYIALLESPPAYIENWRTGGEGERRTARALAPLRRSGCVLLHDLPDRGRAAPGGAGNVDHVVVSPAGVFVLDSKAYGGEVAIVGETVHVQRTDDDSGAYSDRRTAPALRGQAVRLREDLQDATDVRFVRAVAVIWGRFDSEAVTHNDVTFVPGERIAEWLQAQPTDGRTPLSIDRVAQVADCIRLRRPSEPHAWWRRLRKPAVRYTDGPSSAAASSKVS